METALDPRWAAVVARDPTADGAFFYSVRTTGVYCRPSCKARLAQPENVDFHASTREAEAAGFRPCERCRPQPDLNENLDKDGFAMLEGILDPQQCRMLVESYDDDSQ